MSKPEQRQEEPIEAIDSECDFSGFPIKPMQLYVFIPSQRSCKSGTGRYMDVNCALAALDKRKEKGEIGAEAASRAEKWLLEAFNLPGYQCTRAPDPETVNAKTVDEYIANYEGERICPSTLGPCRSTAIEERRKIVARTEERARKRIEEAERMLPQSLLSQFADHSGQQPVRPAVIVKFECSLPRRRCDIDESPTDLRDYIRDHEKLGKRYFMPAEVHSNGVILYPSACIDPAALSAAAAYGRLTIGFGQAVDTVASSGIILSGNAEPKVTGVKRGRTEKGRSEASSGLLGSSSTADDLKTHWGC
jgi:hypothetical protein